MTRFVGIAAVALLAGAAYLGYETVESPANQLFGSTVVRGSAAQRVVALTFDDGPNPPYTDRILDVLKDAHASATFFVVGQAAAAYPASLRRIVREGHALGNHSWDHAHLNVLSRGAVEHELRRTSDAIFAATGIRPRFMRPPFGARSFTVIDEAKREGYTVVMWSDALSQDWERLDDSVIADRVVERVRPGSIVVLHDGNRGRVCALAAPAHCDRSQAARATRTIIARLRAEGYRLVTIPQLLADARGEGAGR